MGRGRGMYCVCFGSGAGGVGWDGMGYEGWRVDFFFFFFSGLMVAISLALPCWL